MPVSLSDENRVVLQSSVFGDISELNRRQSEHIQTELLKITRASYTPAKLVYKQYGDLKVFRCGGKVRIFGVILENLTYISDFDHLVIVLTVTPHEYDQAGVTKQQAKKLQEKFGKIESRDEFYSELTGEVLDSSDIRQLL